MKIRLILLTIAFTMNIAHIYSQTPPATGKSETEKIPPEYYKIFKEHFYKEDEYLEKISDPTEEASYFAITKDENGKVVSIGYLPVLGKLQKKKRLL